MPRPIIGLIADSPEQARALADAIERNGGQAWEVVAEEQPSPVDAVDRVAGLLVCGYAEGMGAGEDGRQAQADLGAEDPVNAARLESLEAALEADLPVLCIGAGMHALNRALGGEPARDVAGHISSDATGAEVSAFHHIYISPGSKLAAVVGSGGFVRVNSRHRRGVREAQKSRLLLASAYSVEDGIVEALESPAHGWAIGVQFNPERRKEVPPHFERLFRILVERARGGHVARRRP